MEGTIRVDAQELKNAAQEFETKNNSIKDITGEMLSLARGLNSQWEGESATAYINRFNELEDDMQMVNTLIAEHATDLQEMAEVYLAAENETESIAQGVNATLIS